MLSVVGAMCLGLVAAVAEPPALTYETFRSPPVSLRSGQIANTNSEDYPLDFVKGPVAVRYFASRVVDEAGNNVSMADLYVHHWLIYDGGSNAGVCSNLPNIWGIGAELNNLIYTYPYPTAYVTTGNEDWSTNLHFIRTSNVPSEKVQDCIECRCEDSDPPLRPHGEVGCCQDQSMCWGMENSTLMDAQNYYLEYKVGYVPVTPDVVPLQILSMDVTATTTTDCQIQYDVPQLGPGEEHTMASDSVLPTDWNVSWVGIHQHIGGLRLTMEHYRAGVKMGDLCNAAPVYTEEGEDKGHLVDIPPCVYDTPYQLLKGDVVRMTSVYGPRTLPQGNPWHAGVMGLAFLAATVKPDPQAQCMQTMHYYCGVPIYPTHDYCIHCVTNSEVFAALQAAGCTDEMVQAECNKNNDDGNIPAPDSVSGMALRINADDTPVSHFNLTCPHNVWCAVSLNMVDPVMVNSTAWVYSDDGTGNMGFQVRTLGFHNAGVALGDYPADITVGDEGVEILFDVTTPASNSERICILFARGADTVTSLSYHGSERGFVCIPIQQLAGK